MHSKYPNIRVALLGEDENAFAIVERVQRAMRVFGARWLSVSHCGSLPNACQPVTKVMKRWVT
jgi:hypothetical protein